MDKVTGKEIRDNLYQGKFQLCIRNNIVTKQAVIHWNGVAREVV